MDIPVLLEPTPTGVRATTGAPLNLVAEGPDKAAVLAEIQAQLTVKLSGGASVAFVAVSVPSPFPSLDIAQLRVLAAEMASDPFVAEWARATREYRAETNTIPDSDADPDESVTPMPAHIGSHMPADPVPAARP